jgi:hypothetical protein
LLGSVLSATGSRNWFHRPRKLKIATAAMPGRAIGSMIRKKARQSPAPSISAASYTSFGRLLKNA